MRWLRGWIPALRIARREARRARGRSALVIVMIGLPVLLLSYAAASYDMGRLTPAEQLDRDLGRYDAQVSWVSTGPITQHPDGQNYSSQVGPPAEPVTAAQLAAVLPAGTKVTQLAQSGFEVYTPNGVGGVSSRALDLADPQLAGMVELIEGTAPARSDEVAVNARLADRLGIGLGGKLRTVTPDRTYTVTALVEFPNSLSDTVVLRPDGVPEMALWLVATPAPLSWDDVRELNAKGLLVRSRAVVLDPPPVPAEFVYGGDTQTEELALGVVLIGLIMLEIVLLAGPAFAVGARRRSRDLALVAAAGGTPAQLRRVVLADGVVLGLAAAVSGVVLGIALAAVGRPLYEEYLLDARAGGWRFFPLAQAGLIVLAVGTGLLAAMVPAFTAARQSVVTVLAGRRGVIRSRKRWITLGLAMAAIGTAIAVVGATSSEVTVILAGLVVGELGLVLLTPSLVGLIAKLGHRLPLAPRIALRDTARNRGSAAPAISAVMAAVAGAVAIGAFLGAEEQHSVDNYDPQLPLGHIGVRYTGADPAPDFARVRTAVEQSLRGADAHVLPGVGCARQPVDPEKQTCAIELMLPPAQRCPSWGDGEMDQQERNELAERDPRCGYDSFVSYAYLAVDDGAGLSAITSAPPEQLAAARAALAAGGVVVADPRYLVDGQVAITPVNGPPPADLLAAPTVSVPGAVLSAEDTAIMMVVSPQLVQEIGLAPRAENLVAAVDHVPTGVEVEKLTAALRAISPQLMLQVETGPQFQEEPIIWILGIIAAIVALGAAGVATGLAAADSRADLATLATVGASPRLRRLLSLSQSGVISGLGSLLGVIAGLGTAGVLIAALNASRSYARLGETDLSLYLPWDSLAIVLAVPLVAMAGAGLLTRSRLPIERRL